MSRIFLVAFQTSELIMRAWLNNHRRRQELTVFLILTLVLAPVLAVGTVGGYGLGIWVYQMIAGPPGVPAKPIRTPGTTRD